MISDSLYVSHDIILVIKQLRYTGKIKLPDHLRNNDFEDIAVYTEPYGSDYIYVGDIGNDWPGHCPGVDQRYRMVHIFREPDLQLYR